MFNAFAKVEVKSDKTQNIEKALRFLLSKDVLVGIPQEKSSRPEDETITNAELAFIHSNGIRERSMRADMAKDVQEKGYHEALDMYIYSHGSPLWQSPPRPIIEPAIEDDKEVISELMGEASTAALDGNIQKANQKLQQAGLEGQAASQDWFDNPKNKWAPNSPRTVEEKGSDKPLIDTGELRKAITYVIRERK